LDSVRVWNTRTVWTIDVDDHPCDALVQGMTPGDKASDLRRWRR
jgi:hypothetical protein